MLMGASDEAELADQFRHRLEKMPSPVFLVCALATLRLIEERVILGIPEPAVELMREILELGDGLGSSGVDSSCDRFGLIGAELSDLSEGVSLDSAYSALIAFACFCEMILTEGLVLASSSRIYLADCLTSPFTDMDMEEGFREMDLLDESGSLVESYADDAGSSVRGERLPENWEEIAQTPALTAASDDTFRRLILMTEAAKTRFDAGGSIGSRDLYRMAMGGSL